MRMATSQRPTRQAPLKRPEFEDNVTIKRPIKKLAQKTASKPIRLPKRGQKTGVTCHKGTENQPTSIKEFRQLGTTHLAVDTDISEHFNPQGNAKHLPYALCIRQRYRIASRL